MKMFLMHLACLNEECYGMYIFQEENGDYTYMEHIKIPLTHGSLLLMEGASQTDWQVSVI